MGGVIKALRLLFRKPDSFRDDPYGYLTNQLGHGWLGFSLNTWVCWVLYTFGGAWPNQVSVYLWVTAVYFILWEAGTQGWRGWDSIEDTAFVAYGGSVWAYVDMYYVIDRVFAFTIGAMALVSYGVVKRLRGAGFD